MVAQLVKGLKPKKLKVDQIRLNILNELRAEGAIVKREFEKTTATWKGAKPTFEIAIGLNKDSAIVIVGPAGSAKGAQKWIWLDEGTKPHVIRAKNAPNLVFKTKFTAKTKVKVFGSRKGSSNPPWRATEKVNHPGIEARDWTGQIVKRRRKRFTNRIVKAAQL